MSLSTKLRDCVSCFVKVAIGLRVIRIQGNSMMPLAQDGDFILSKPLIWPSKIQVGNVIVFKYAYLGYVLKVVSLVESDTVRVQGLSSLSAKPEYFGQVPIGDIKGLAFAVVSQSIELNRQGIGWQWISRSSVCNLLSADSSVH